MTATTPAMTPDSVAKSPPRKVRRRPTPVTILAVIQAIGALGYLLSVAALAGAEFQLLQDLADRGFRIINEDTITYATAASWLLGMAVVGFAASILMFRMHRFGWTITMLLTGWSLATQIYVYVTTGDLVPWMMGIPVITALYLNQRQVRAAFGIGEPKATSNPELDERA